jgi:hypothetical protein
MPYRTLFDLVDCADDHIRGHIFREAAGTLSGSLKSETDVPGSIAAMMEKAFKTGIELARQPGARIEGIHRRDFGQLELPKAPRSAFEEVRLALGCAQDHDGSIRVEVERITRECLVLFMRPADQKVPFAPRADRWFVGGAISNATFSNTVTSFWIEAGLYEKPYKMEDGWKVTFLTEWGLEFALTGSTSRPGHRVDGGSTTIDLYRRHFDGDRSALLRAAARKSGLLEPPPPAVQTLRLFMKPEPEERLSAKFRR